MLCTWPVPGDLYSVIGVLVIWSMLKKLRKLVVRRTIVYATNMTTITSWPIRANSFTNSSRWSKNGSCWSDRLRYANSKIYRSYGRCSSGTDYISPTRATELLYSLVGSIDSIFRFWTMLMYITNRRHGCCYSPNCHAIWHAKLPDLPLQLEVLRQRRWFIRWSFTKTVRYAVGNREHCYIPGACTQFGYLSAGYFCECSHTARIFDWVSEFTLCVLRYYCSQHQGNFYRLIAENLWSSSLFVNLKFVAKNFKPLWFRSLIVLVASGVRQKQRDYSDWFQLIRK